MPENQVMGLFRSRKRGLRDTIRDGRTVSFLPSCKQQQNEQDTETSKDVLELGRR